MSSITIRALTTLGSAAISALVAYLVARHYTKNEIRRLKLTWKREDFKSVDADFYDMVYTVTHFCKSKSYYNTDFGIAAGKINKARSSSCGSIAPKLDTLYLHFVKSEFDKIDADLDAVITEHRNMQIKKS